MPSSKSKSRENPLAGWSLSYSADVTPITVNNFLSLCKGDQIEPKSQEPYIYKECVFHRVISGFMAQVGDFNKKNREEGGTVFAYPKFKDENFKKNHVGRGLLSMANSGPNTNGSQFFITFVDCPWLDGKHTVFGKIVEGDKLLDDIESCGSSSGKPSKLIQIVNCGQL